MTTHRRVATLDELRSLFGPNADGSPLTDAEKVAKAAIDYFYSLRAATDRFASDRLVASLYRVEATGLQSLLISALVNPDA